jgi:hypothetical protein
MRSTIPTTGINTHGVTVSQVPTQLARDFSPTTAQSTKYGVAAPRDSDYISWIVQIVFEGGGQEPRGAHGRRKMRMRRTTTMTKKEEEEEQEEKRRSRRRRRRGGIKRTRGGGGGQEDGRSEKRSR